MRDVKNILIANDSLDGLNTALEKAAMIEHYSGAELHVAEVIYDAATDGTDQIRYISGQAAAQLLANRSSAEQDEQFVAGMRAQFCL